MDYPRLLKMLRWPVAFLLLTCMASASWAQTQSDRAAERATLKMTLEEMGPEALARGADATDRAVSTMNVAQLQVYTYNMGIQLGRVFSSGRATYPNPDGTLRAYWFTSSVAFAVEGGPWHATGMVHETSDFHSMTKMDWEAKDGARGIQFSNPPQLTGGYPIYATSDLPATWPTSGWPAPETVTEVWAGTDTWNKWERVGDRNSYCVFDDKYADREGDGQSISLGIEVKKRAIAYGAMNLIFLQYEFTNTSSNNYTGVYIGHICDKGSPSANDFEDAYLEYDETNQMIYSVAGNYDAATGTHTRPTSTEQLGFVAQMVLESPTGSFREDNYDPDNRGVSIVTTSANPMPLEDATMTFGPDNILTRVALIDWGDRVLINEESLYGALSGDITVMESGHAENVWKTGLSGDGSPILKQDGDDYKAYNSSWDSDCDHFYYTSSGPFSMAAGASFDFVVAFVGGLTQPQLIAGATLAKHTYNIQFAGPAAPPAPTSFVANGITAGPGGKEYDPRIHAYPIHYAPTGNITLSWDLLGSTSTPDPSSGVLDFEGIRIYRSMDRGARWGAVISDAQGAFAEWVPIRQFDLNDGITGPDGISYSYLGDDTGLASSWTDPDIMDGVEYWYCITSYDKGEFDATGQIQLLRSLESPKGSNPNSPTVIAVVAGSRPAGYTEGTMTFGTTTGSAITLLEAQNAWETNISAVVMNETALTGDSYSLDVTNYYVEADGDTVNLAGILLENTTTSTDFFTAPILGSDAALGGDNVMITDGFKIFTSQPNNGDGGVYSFTQTVDIDPDSSYSVYLQEAYMQSAGSASNRANVNQFMDTIEFRFTGWVTAAGDTNWGFGLSGGGGVNGQMIQFPFELWDTETNTRLMPGSYWPGQPFWDGYYFMVTNVSYFEADGVTVRTWNDLHPSTDTVYWGYNTGNPLSRSDWCYRFYFNETSWATNSSYWDVGDVWTLTPYMTMIKEAGSSFTFSTTEPTITDSLVTLDDIKVVPNPYYIYAEWDLSNNRRKIQFTNVPMNSEIEIYTLSGELVAILDNHGDATAVAGGKLYNSNRVGTVDWNIWTYEFTEAAYGLYIYVVKTDDGETKVGKFAIIR